MDSNELHDWMLRTLGQLRGEQAWEQFQAMPEAMKDQILSQPIESLPSAEQISGLYSALAQSAANGTGDPNTPIDREVVRQIAHAQSKATAQKAEGEPEGRNGGRAGSSSVAGAPGADSGHPDSAPTMGFHSARLDDPGSADTSASDANEQAAMITDKQKSRYHTAVSTASLWLDSAATFNPPAGKTWLLSRDEWIDSSIDNWIKLVNPVAKQTIAAITQALSQRLGDDFNGSAGLFAGPVPISLPGNFLDPSSFLRSIGSTSFSLQLGRTAGKLSREVLSGFDQGIAMIDNAAGALLPQNVDDYAADIELPAEEVATYMALRELASARLYASTGWLMPQIQTLVDKYARSITLDVDAIERQLEQSEELSADGVSSAVDISSVAMPENDEQKEAKHALERLLALVEGWIDCVTWQAGQAYLPHLSQMREMMRRRRAVGGPAEETFQQLLGLEIHPVQSREACALWEKLTRSEGIGGRDAHWRHPDLLPALPSTSADSTGSADTSETGSGPASTSDGLQRTGTSQNPASAPSGSSAPSSPSKGEPSEGDPTKDWNAALDQLLAEEARTHHDGSESNGSESDGPEQHGSDDSNDSDGSTGTTGSDGSRKDDGTGADPDSPAGLDADDSPDDSAH